MKAKIYNIGIILALAIAVIIVAIQFHNQTPTIDNVVGTSTNVFSEEYILYAVQDSDSWWIISEKFYNDGKYYTYLMDFNNYSIKDVLVIGTVIQVPYLAE